MTRLTVLLLISTALLLAFDYLWRVTSISLRKALPIVLPLWLLGLAIVWHWLA